MPKGKRANPKHPIDEGAPASVIAAKFGGMSRFAEALGLAPSTVHRWLVRGNIDGRRFDEIMQAAKANGIKLRPADFVDTRPQEQRGPVAVELEAATA